MNLLENLLSYLQNYYPAAEKNISKIEHQKKLFLKRFPLNNLQNMTLEQYDKLGNKYSFCNMIENQTPALASGDLGINSNKYFYQKQSDGQYYIKRCKAMEKYYDKDIGVAFEKYKLDAINFILTFTKKTYDPKCFLENTGTIKTKLILLYRNNELLGITSSNSLRKILSQFNIKFDKNNYDSIQLNMLLINYLEKNNILEKYPNLILLGACIYQFFSCQELQQDDFLDRLNNSGTAIKHSLSPTDYTPMEKVLKKPLQKKTGNSFYYPTNPKVRINALLNSNYLCEGDNEHKSFTSKVTHQRYVETHHLVPRQAQDSFPHNLDNELNIVCLCSHCHNLLHYGELEEKKALLQSLYNKRKQALTQAGITNINGEPLTYAQLERYYD